MAAQPVIVNTDPNGPVEFSENAIKKVFESTGYVIVDTKEDGVQLNLIVDPVGNAIGMEKASFAMEALSRAGKRLPALQEALNQSGALYQNAYAITRDDTCIYPDGFMLQAEIIVPGQPAEVTSGMLRRTKQSKKDPKPLLQLSDIEVHVFGVVPLGTILEEDKEHDVTHAVMKYHVEAMVALLKKHCPYIAWKTIESLDAFTLQEMEAIYEARREAKKEGVVVCDPNAIWKRGKKVGKWKMKPDDLIDGKVIGLVWGTPGLANEGKVIGFEVLLEDGQVVNACGISRELMDEFTEKYRDAVYQAGSSLVNPYQDWAVSVAFMERFKDGSLRHPSFSRFRGISDPLTKE